MNICFIAKDQPWRFYAGGIATYLESITPYLAGHGHTVHIISLSYGKEEDYEVNGVHIHGIRIPEDNKKMRLVKQLRYFFMPKFVTFFIEDIILYKRFKELERQYDFDIIESDDVSGSSLLITLFCKKPVITRAHGSSFLVEWLNRNAANAIATTATAATTAHAKHKEKFMDRIQSRLVYYMESLQYRRSALVVANSKATMQLTQSVYHLQGHKGKNFSYLYIPHYALHAQSIFTEREETLQSLRITTPFILYVGRIEYRKGLMVLARAIGPVLRRHPNLHLYIVGFNTEEETVAIIKYYMQELSDLQDRIHFRPSTIRSRVYALMRSCEFVVLPSIMEPFGYTCTEAMATGALVVAADGSGYAEQIARSGVNGLLFKNKDSRSLEKQMEKALALSPAEKGRIIAHARKRQEYFQSDELLKQHLALYYTVAAGKTHLALGQLKEQQLR